MAKRKEITLKQLSKRLGTSLKDTASAYKVGLFSGIIQDTRVKTGRMKGNWQASDDTPVTTTTLRVDPEGDETIKDMEESISPIGVSYLTNNVSYVAKWEEVDGMVARNVARINRSMGQLFRDKN